MPNSHVISIKDPQGIPDEYKNTPIELLLRYQNFNAPHDEKYLLAQILIGMCIDYRKQLNIPENFAYIIRTGGANMKFNEFKVSFAIAVGGVKVIALIGHTQCGMVNLETKKELFIQGLVDNAGWSKTEAEEHFLKFAPIHEIYNETNFVMSEAKRLKSLYPKIIIAPLIYKVEDGLLYLVQEKK